MIIDTIDNLEKYAALNPLFPKVVEFLKTNDLSKMPDGKHEYYYMKNSSYTAKWFDALEIMDFYLDGEGAENDEASEI